MNVTITEAPYAETVVTGHIDTSSGSIVPNEGHLDKPDVHVRLPYARARELLLDRQIDMVMIAFMSGEIEVEGDVTRLLDLQAIDVSATDMTLANEVAARLEAITS